MEKVTLFKFESEGIKILMELYFNGQVQLIFDGYDIGKTVEAAWGDSDYEYSYIIEPLDVKKIYNYYNVIEGQESNLLNILKEHFNGNKAYSEFGEFMNNNKIDYSSSTWT